MRAATGYIEVERDLCGRTSVRKGLSRVVADRRT
jgi:hypothetical protein